jgi:hypothetical protein
MTIQCTKLVNATGLLDDKNQLTPNFSHSLDIPQKDPNEFSKFNFLITFKTIY